MYWHDGWNWFWMTFLMGFWLLIFGAVVYAAVRLAQHDRKEQTNA